jgi:hypothetical protein
MSYTITLTDGNTLVTVADGTANQTTCSMTLIGKNYAGYGQFLDDNFVHLLESGSNNVPPSAPLRGQLWFNTGSNTLQVYNGSTFKQVGGAVAASSAPTSNNAGDLWYDTVNAQLNVYSGSAWIVVGPIYTSGTGVTGAIPATVTDSLNNPHVILEFFVQNQLVAVASKDAAFTLGGSGISNFPASTLISPGIQLAQYVSGNLATQFTGTATTAIALQGSGANAFMTTGASTSCVGSVSLNSNANPTAIINAAGNGIGNIGSTSSYFNTVYARSSSALYADVAERFAADAEYAAGTVVELGGTAEITKSTTELSDSVFGVISTEAAYLMNSGAGTNITHPPVAMTGRVPVSTVGIVRKGDRLVSAGAGVARSAKPGEATAFNVIGRALEDKLDVGLGLVEAIVSTK